MALRFDLGPFDQIHIGKCVLKNSHERALFIVEGEMPILRAKDVLSPAVAANSLERLYCCVQQMYLEETYEKYQGSYLALVNRSLTEDPTLHPDLQVADQLVTSGQYYKALKGLKKLIRKEAFTVDYSPSVKYVPRYGGWKKAL